MKYSTPSPAPGYRKQVPEIVLKNGCKKMWLTPANLLNNKRYIQDNNDIKP